MRKRILLLGLMLLSASFAFADDTDPEPPQPDRGPLTMKIVAKKTTYQLDLQGMTAADYAKAAKTGKATPIKVDMEMVLTNNTTSPMRVRVWSSANRLTLGIKGGGVVVSGRVSIGKQAKKLSYTILQPKEKVSIPLETLTSNTASTSGLHHYWTQAGDYTLEATYRVGVSLNYDPNKPTTMTTVEPKASIKVKVEK